MGSEVEIVRSASTKAKRKPDAFTTTEDSKPQQKQNKELDRQQEAKKELITPKTPRENSMKNQLETSTENKEESSVPDVDSAKQRFGDVL